MTEGIVDGGASESKAAFELAREAARKALSSPESRRALSAAKDFEEFETDVARGLQEGAAAGISELVSAVDADREAPDCGRCGSRMSRRGRRPLRALSRLGWLRVERTAWTRGCSPGVAFPLDAELGVRGRNGPRATAAALRALGRLAAGMSFGRSAEAARELLFLRVNAKWMERLSRWLGGQLAEADAAAASAASAGGAPAAMCVGLDGTGVPARPSETAGRAGKEGADPSGSPRAATREAKVVVFGVLGEGGAVVPARRSAAIDSAAARDTDAEPSAFARRLRTAAEASGFAAAKLRVVLGDGAKWIWNAAAEALPGCVEIVDLRHAREHLWEVGRALFGEGAALCAAWSREWCAALSEGRLDDVLAELRGRADCEAALRCAGHVEANRERMRYPEFRAMGLPVGSGVVESACGAVVADRLKRGGMRWTVAGANAMLALRCWILDRRLHDFQPAAARSPPLAAAA